MLGNLFGKAKKNPISTLTSSVSGGASNLFGGDGGINDFLFGKKQKDIKGSFAKQDPRLAALSKLGYQGNRKAIGFLNQEINRARGEDPSKLAALDLANRERQVGGQFEDTLRRANQLSAQRGLGTSSIGLGQVLGAEKARAEAIGNVRAQAPLLQQQYANERTNRIMGLSGGIGSILNQMPTRQYYEGARGQREGGLIDIAAPITGGILGGKAGGAQGAMMGMQAGQGLGQVLKSRVG